MIHYSCMHVTHSHLDCHLRTNLDLLLCLHAVSTAAATVIGNGASVPWATMPACSNLQTAAMLHRNCQLATPRGARYLRVRLHWWSIGLPTAPIWVLRIAAPRHDPPSCAQILGTTRYWAHWAPSAPRARCYDIGLMSEIIRRSVSEGVGGWCVPTYTCMCLLTIP